MARQAKRPFGFDLTPIIDTMGMEWLIEQVGAKRVIEHLGAKRVIEQLGAKQLIEELGRPRVVEELGGLKQLWAELTPEQRRQWKRLAQQ